MGKLIYLTTCGQHKCEREEENAIKAQGRDNNDGNYSIRNENGNINKRRVMEMVRAWEIFHK